MRKRSSRNAAEIVKVHGGRIVRSTGGKDRHSKVCTAKGTRDRRVRLAAHTAIQFYDVQDRLGFDRPSRAVDWLINKAKAAIDELDELPPWNPATTFLKCDSGRSKTLGGRDEAAATLVAEDDGEGDGMYGSSSLLPPSMDSDAIADTIKSSTPMGMQFQSYPSADLLHRRSSSQSQDLKLSLQSLQDPILIQSHHHSREQNQEEAAQIGFDNASVSWAENQRLIGWNSAGVNGGGGFMFIPPHASLQPLLFGHGVGSNGAIGQSATHFFSQRGTLQSSNTPSNRAQIGSNSNNQNYHQEIPSLSGIGYASSGGFSGFPFTARIQGDEEDHDDGDPNKPSSVSSASRH